MLRLDALGVDRLAEIYLTSNTPAYLYRQFRADASLRAFALESTSTDLLNHLERYTSSPSGRLGDVVRSYAALVALTFREPDGEMQQLAARKARGLEWATQILELWLESSTRTQRITIAVTPTIEMTHEGTARGTIDVNRIEIVGGGGVQP
jgi:hypothetical protein